MCVTVIAAPAMDVNRGYQNPPTLEALLPTLVTVEQAKRLFDLMPGLEYCSYDQPSGYLLHLYLLLFFYRFIFHIHPLRTGFLF